MDSFKEYLKESGKQMPWNGKPNVGWWADQKVLRLYHGTHKNNINSILKNGINMPDPKTGLISMALEPNTSFGYAAMSGVGGETQFRKLANKVCNTPPQDRVVFVFDIPMDWIKQHYDENLTGNTPPERMRMTDKSKYKPNVDFNYYMKTELRFKTAIPLKFLVGYMVKS